MASYLGFQAVFLAPLLVALLVGTFTRSMRLPRARVQWLGVAIITALAVTYTTPWDNYLIARGVWSYGEGTVAARLWHAPVGEYLFFVVQPVITALWLYQFYRPRDDPLSYSLATRAVGALAGLAVAVVGVGLYFGADATVYLGALLAWAGPVLALQWAFGWPYLLGSWRSVAIGVGLPTVYLWAADTIALELGIWELNPRFTTGVALAGLPIEEAAFFAFTNLLVVQGLVLWLWVVERVEADDDAVPAAVGDRWRARIGAESG